MRSSWDLTELTNVPQGFRIFIRLLPMEVGDKKLLVLHLKGFLVDCYHQYSRTDPCPNRRPHGQCNYFYVYKRPGADKFLKFCFKNFVVGVWSAAQEHNVMALSDFTFGPLKKKLAFIWTNAQCTDTGLTYPGKKKPLVRKELSKLWSGEHGVTWGKDVFGPSNTILIDDDPAKIEKNPPNTAILLKTYRVTDPEDDHLEKLQKYLGLLADAKDVQKYMETNPFELEEENSVKDPPSEAFKRDDSQALDLLIAKALSLKIIDESSSKSVMLLLNEAFRGSPHSESQLKGYALLLLQKYNEIIQLSDTSLALAESTVNSDSSSQDFERSQRQSEDDVLKVWWWELTARAKYYLGRLEEAHELLQKSKTVSRNCQIDSIIDVLNKDFPLSMSRIRDLLHQKVAGNEAFQAGKYTEAKEHYTAALACIGDSLPFFAVCFYNRAAAFQALRHVTDAIADCSQAIILEPMYTEAISKRAILYEKVRDYAQCCLDLQRLRTFLENQKLQVRIGQSTPGRLNRTEDLRQVQAWLAKAKAEMRKDYPLDYYMILGLEHRCTSADIKKAYKKAALKHHPDKVGQFISKGEGGVHVRRWKEISNEVQREADGLFKSIGQAYAVLSDPQERSDYDRKEDSRKLRANFGIYEIYRNAQEAPGRDGWKSSRG
ncbi:hypothetical protein R1flu_003835 [Riccia fluitans]|uniref:Uncharacterized protein n=1 Tax=Riccia fluitans TaxID=41844 RepID=A0ABD1YAR6_9MARC